jgi:hypothetical protein
MSKRFYLSDKVTGVDHRVLHIIERGEAGYAYEIQSVEGRRKLVEPQDAKHYMLVTSSTDFYLGRVLAGPGVMATLDSAGEGYHLLLVRYEVGDWGIIGPEDQRANDTAVRDGSRLFAAYRLDDGHVVYVMSDAEGPSGARGRTWITLPGDC